MSHDNESRPQNDSSSSWSHFLTRQLQAAAVFIHVLGFTLLPFPLTLFTFFFTPYWWLVLLYLLWTVWDGDRPNQGGSPSETHRNRRLWRYFADYFPAKLHKTADLPADRNYVFGVHPHGIIGLASVVTFGTNATHFDALFPGIQRSPVTLPIPFRIPFTREWLLAAGGISSHEHSIDYVLQGRDGRGRVGRSVAIVVGGAEEALDAHPGASELELANRQGFVRVALRNGASLVPVYHFGETELYHQMENNRHTLLRKIQWAFKRIFSFSPPIFYGQFFSEGGLGLMPYRAPLNTVVGAPIHVEKCENPSKEQIHRLHEEYCKALTQLFDEHKTRFAVYKDVKLKIC